MLWCWVGLWIPSHSRLCINGPSEPGHLTGGCVCQWVKIHLHITLSSTSPSCKLTFSRSFLNIIASTWSQTNITHILPSQQKTIFHIHTKQLPMLFFFTYLSSATYTCNWNLVGARGGAVGWGTVLQAGRSWVRLLVVSLEFFIDIILPATLWPWGWLSL